MMPLSTVMSRLLSTLLLLVWQTAAATKDYNAPPAEPTTDCYSIDMFSTLFFLSSTVLCGGVAPDPSTCLFYTSAQGPHARAYAAKNGLVTIWDLWDPYLYNDENVVGNRMRCIFFGIDRPSIQYFKYMSQALALLCTGETSVMDANLATIPASNDPSLLDNPSLFFNTEFPTWKSNGQASIILAIMAPDGTDSQLWYDPTRPDSKARRREAAMEAYPFNRSAAEVSRRASDCGAYAGAESNFDACVIPW